MRHWNLLQWLYLIFLTLVIGIPLYLKELLTGNQECRLADWLDSKLP